MFKCTKCKQKLNLTNRKENAMYSTLIQPSALIPLLNSNCVILDCRFRLEDPEYGYTVYQQGHIPGAYYASLESVLSGLQNGQNGRHPLPERQHLAQHLGNYGINTDTQIVTYDDEGGMFAARAWWLLRWLGHKGTAVLDGGYKGWLAHEGPITTLVPDRPAMQFQATVDANFSTVSTQDIMLKLGNPTYTIIDARSHERYLGHSETLHPMAGHIPGAINRHFRDNLTQEGYFKPIETLRHEWQALLNGRKIGDSVHQCGSGVSACVNILALNHAFGENGHLYPGSWSEWCSDPSRPRETQ